MPGGANVTTQTGQHWVSPVQMTEWQRLSISPTGAVRIGRPPVAPSPHTDYKLAVQGKLVAQSVFVTLTNWPDYVFAPVSSPLK